MGALRRYENELVINVDNEAAAREARDGWIAALKHSRDAFEKMLEGEEDEDNAMARAALQALSDYEAAATRVVQQIQSGAYDSRSAASNLLKPAKAHVLTAEQKLEAIEKVVAAEAEATRDEFEASMRNTMWLFLATLGGVVLLVIPLTLLNSRSILAPMHRARAVAMAIAEGDLTQEVPTDGADEAADLLRSLAHMQAALSRLVGEVREASGSIHHAANEVAVGNSDLSGRTEQAAGSLQQTASSIQQLTQSVRQSEDAASQANQLAASARSVAQRGGDVVSQVVSTMNEINTSSKRIADIIGTIDGIAFQTNILALNAAVEAARAGEQGRGFAVVASEVRSLAQRSAEAAREIKVLIGTSVDKVETGARLVQDAGSTMGEIVASVQRVTDVIGEITAAADEQSQGIAQVNGAVASLDQMTQQNAALVEESAAAAESLKDQAQRLTASMQVFRLSGHGGEGGAAVLAPPVVSPVMRTAAVSKPVARPAPTTRPAEAAQAAITQARETSRPVSPPSNDDWESF
jgi:methyl-accepting chemotaxis protein